MFIYKHLFLQCTSEGRGTKYFNSREGNYRRQQSITWNNHLNPPSNHNVFSENPPHSPTFQLRSIDAPAPEGGGTLSIFTRGHSDPKLRYWGSFFSFFSFFLGGGGKEGRQFCLSLVPPTKNFLDTRLYIGYSSTPSAYAYTRWKCIVGERLKFADANFQEATIYTKKGTREEAELFDRPSDEFAMTRKSRQVFRSSRAHRHVSARKSYLHFCNFLGEAICVLISFVICCACFFVCMFVCLFLFLLHFVLNCVFYLYFANQPPKIKMPKMQIRSSFTHMTTYT